MRAALALLLLAPVLAGCTSPAPAAEPRARPGDFAVVDLAAFDDRGREVENATGVRAVLAPEVPTRLPPGWAVSTTRTLPPGVVERLTGLTSGGRLEHRFEPAQGYGNWSAERTIRAPRVQDLSPVVTLNATAVEGARATWANQSWAVALAGDGGEVEARLLRGPEPGAVLELPSYWNAHYRLWTSRLVSLNDTALRVEHQPRLGTQADVGGVRYTVTLAADEVVADGNPPLAGQALTFRVHLRELVFPEGAANPPAPDALLVTLDGIRVNVSELARGMPGGTPPKAVLLDFFATWCVTCKQQAPILARAQDEFGAELLVVSVTIDPTDTPERIATFREDARKASLATWGRELPVDWLFAFDPTGQAAKGFSVTTLPREVLLDAQGRIRATSTGLHPWAELREDVAKVLQ